MCALSQYKGRFNNLNEFSFCTGCGLQPVLCMHEMQTKEVVVFDDKRMQSIGGRLFLLCGKVGLPLDRARASHCNKIVLRFFHIFFDSETPITAAVILLDYLKKPDVGHISDFHCADAYNNVPDCHGTASQKAVELVEIIAFCQRCSMMKAPSRAVFRTTPPNVNLPFKRLFIIFSVSYLLECQWHKIYNDHFIFLQAFWLDILRNPQECCTWLIPAGIIVAWSACSRAVVGNSLGMCFGAVRQPRHQAGVYDIRNSEEKQHCGASPANASRARHSSMY